MRPAGLPRGARDHPAGLVVIDKPEGATSHDAVLVVRRALGGVRAGHLGTLDPFATGVLPVLLGAATRLAPWYRGLTKVYEATVRLGSETDTMDGTGRVVSQAPWEHLHEEAVSAVVAALPGEHEQETPMFSARKVGGKRLHELARQGKEVERPRRKVMVVSAVLLAFEPAGGTVRLRVEVSAGTYVRVLATELGRRLGSAAHLSQLRRSQVGPFPLTEAVTLAPDGLAERLAAARIPAGALLPGLPSVALDAAAAEDVRHGRPVPVAHAGLAEGAEVRLLGPDGDLWSIATVTADALARPRLVLRAS